ncbi:uncharacterized protein LOC109856136 [Pseudomyrmex gracilis]|uniref:uncharacterized protein LOC109856136 n=1 Tax=Pseudomyrmex gracilis TaxID=219809 RepID=UPI000995AB5A|nr:uncharacterized protein LOC109856136 [Pseudomyrmex gracilis]
MATEQQNWIYALTRERLLEELEKRELDQTGTVPTLRARLLRYGQYRARGEESPPTPESQAGPSRSHLAVPIEDASVRPNSSSSLLVRAELVVVRADSPIARAESSSTRQEPSVTQVDRTSYRARDNWSAFVEPPLESVQFPSTSPQLDLPYDDTISTSRHGSTNAFRAYEIMRKCNLKFSGARDSDPEEFLIKIETTRSIIPVSDEDIFRCLPFCLTGIALYWFRAKKYSWRSWEEFVAAWRSRFDPDFAFTLRDKIRRRTQGKHEPVAYYLNCMEALFERLNPQWPLAEQLIYAYHNMLPRLKILIHRDDFYNWEYLKLLAVGAESYRPPPLPEQSLIPELAYRPPRKNRNSESLAAAGIEKNKKKEGKNKTSSATISSTRKIDETRKTETADCPNLKCWNCGKMGHASRNCTEAKKLHCYRCGKAEVTIRTCPKCGERKKST